MELLTDLPRWKVESWEKLLKKIVYCPTAAEATKMLKERSFIDVHEEVGNKRHYLETRKKSIDQICTVFQRSRHNVSEANRNSLFSVLHSNAEQAKYFLFQMHDMASIRKCSGRIQDERMIQSGLNQRTMITENNRKDSLYIKDSQEAIKAQLTQSGCQEILKKKSGSALMNHPMNFKIETEAYSFVESSIKTNLVLISFGRSKKEDQIQSVVGCLQIYLDTLQTSFSTTPCAL